MRSFVLTAKTAEAEKLIGTLKGKDRHVIVTVLSESPLKIKYTWRTSMMGQIAKALNRDQVEFMMMKMGLERKDYDIEVLE